MTSSRARGFEPRVRSPVNELEGARRDRPHADRESEGEKPRAGERERRDTREGGDGRRRDHEPGIGRSSEQPAPADDGTREQRVDAESDRGRTRGSVRG